MREQSPLAVCIPPGAGLLLRDLPETFQRQFGVGASEPVTFVQLGAAAYEYRDAIRFKNGREVLLQRLSEGQQVHVLHFSLSDSREDEQYQRLEEEYRQVFS